MAYNVVINGFHGTKKDFAETICEEKEYVYSVRKNHWLGQGVYFFRNDPDQAMSWALNSTKDGEVAVVLGTDLYVNSISMLDLDTRTGIYELKGYVRHLRSEIEKNGFEINDVYSDNNHSLRCFVLDLLPQSIKLIQKSFLLNQPNGLNDSLIKSMGIEMYSVQVCVRNNEVIDKKSIRIINEREKVKRKTTIKKRTKKPNRVNIK
ncbi:hypothetical protein [Salipaludibacillus sp. CF4.18]|uniref:hypothetical protein n=1 Tax=Salipaludibacillus sp. CF4.18 TaxID=3373081 RepID=UPI003EE50F9F